MSPQTDPPMENAGPRSPSEERGGLASASFLGLLVTQLLGALNDNMFRWLAVPIGKQLFRGVIADAEQAENLALSMGLAFLVVPFVALAAPAGYLADRFSKRSVIVWCKVAEILIMLLGVAAIYAENVYALFFVVLLIGCQSALFGPSKLGSIPEIVRADRISAANGLIGLTTVIAVVAGSVAGGFLYAWSWSQESGVVNLWLPTVALLGLGMLGWLSSLLIARLPAANPALGFPYNPFRRTWGDLRTLSRSRPLLRVALGIAFFWSLASLAQINVDTFVLKELQLPQKDVGLLLAVLSAGVGLGSVLAGIWSGGRVELGIVPLGAAGIALSSMLLFTSESYLGTGLWLFTLGASAGLFDVPLSSYMQHRSPAKFRGSILAASNFLTFSGMLLTSGLFYLLRGPLGLSAPQIFLLAGIATLPVFIYIICLLPGATIRFAVWLASHTIYRLRVYGHDYLPETGGAVLIANHITWLDGVFLLLSSSRPIRMVAYAEYVQGWWIRHLARIMGVIPITPGRRSMVDALRQAREAVEKGELVCIFPEGELSRSGQLQAFKPGVLTILRGTRAPVIPVFLDELWGSIFSYQGGRFFWKWPQRWPYPVSIHFGPRVPEPYDVHRLRQAVQLRGVSAVNERKDRKRILPWAFLRMCRRNFFRPKIADSTGMELSGGNLLLRSLIFRRLLRKKLLAPDEKFVGLLLPPTVPAVLANVALPLCGRVAVNLNYTVPADVMNACIAQCGIRHVLTSRKVMERLNLDLNADVVYLEDLVKKVSAFDKLVAALGTYLLPTPILARVLGLHKISGDDLLTVIFTSGSTGEPKGVMLTHHNVASNIEAIDQVIHLTKADTAVGVLPFFHSYGYTATMWTILAFDAKGVYHFNPLDAQQVGKLCGKHRATVLMVTPTFLRSYLRRCQPEDFASLEVIFASAEKLPAELVNAFEEKFGIRPVEAYGATELSPLVSVNIPASRSPNGDTRGVKEGTVGRPIPGVAAKIVHPETGEELGIDQPGMLLISGPNVMKGYFKRPELSAQVIRDGWYVTGDIALIDADGFIHITGRESRFSKIGGEMVPHIKIEETLQKILSADEEELKAVVTAVPDAKKGERLIVLHKQLDKTIGEICKELAATGLPNLWIPSPDSFYQVDEIPVLGSGKLDLKALKTLAQERAAGTSQAAV